jgi:hypothetical protein
MTHVSKKGGSDEQLQFVEFAAVPTGNCEKVVSRPDVFSASLGFLALAAVMATGNRLHQTAPAAGLASAGGNLVPLW